VYMFCIVTVVKVYMFCIVIVVRVCVSYCDSVMCACFVL